MDEKQTLYPMYSRGTAMRLWLSGLMPDSFYVSHYMTPEEAWEYEHYKRR